MTFLIGLLFVILCVFLPYKVHGGDLNVLWQPLEFIIIIGAAIGGLIISLSKDELLDTLKSLKYTFKSKPYSKKHYEELLVFFYKAFKLIKTKGVMSLESHIDKPHESTLFQESPLLLQDHHAVEFICDYFRIIVTGVDNAMSFEDLVSQEIEIKKHHFAIPGHAIKNMGDSFPAIGIVAAVLGVINTMKSIAEPPEVLGSLIAAALVGTFSGILIAYGVVGPMGSYLTTFGAAQGTFFECIKSGLVSYIQGNSPIVCLEFMRKVIPDHERPSFTEIDQLVNGK